jgi:hypothetical protein
MNNINGLEAFQTENVPIVVEDRSKSPFTFKWFSMMINRISLPNNRIALFFPIFICYSLLTASGITSQRFMDNGDKTITDNQTGLMWISEDNGFPISWFDAVKYCENLKIGYT